MAVGHSFRSTSQVGSTRWVVFVVTERCFVCVSIAGTLNFRLPADS